MTKLLSSLTNAVKHWYIPMIVGLLFSIFGIYILTVPLEAFLSLAILLSISFIVSGASDLFFAIANRKSLEGWDRMLTAGILNLLLGIYLYMFPGISVSILTFIVGFTMLFRSIHGLGFAIELRSNLLASWGRLAFLNILGIIASFILLANPFIAVFSVVTITALVFITIGICSILISLSLKKLKEMPEKIGPGLINKLEDIKKEIKGASE